MFPIKSYAVSVRSSQVYKSFSKRSLQVLITSLFFGCIFIYSQKEWFVYEEKFLQGRNDTHLLSNNSFTSCQGGCPIPPLNDLDPKQVFEACLNQGRSSEYYLTVILVSRNDNYADFQYERFQNMLDSTFLLAQGTKTRLELLIIEWNPDNAKRLIRDTYRFRRSEYLTYRILTVPKEIHDTYHYTTSFKSLYEFEGKNLGIRHARGEYIVCTNQDDIWSSAMYQAISSRLWKRNMIYTQFQDQHSSSEDDLSKLMTLVRLPNFPTDQEIQASCNLTLETNINVGLLSPKPKQINRLDHDNYLHIGHEASDFTLAHRDVWFSVGGYREIGATLWIDVEFLLTAFHTKGIPITYSPVAFNCHQMHRHIIHPGEEYDNKNINVEDIISKEISFANTGDWGLSHLDLYEHGLGCDVFRGGLGK